MEDATFNDTILTHSRNIGLQTMKTDEFEGWIGFIGALEKAQDAGGRAEDALLQQYPSQLARMAVWLSRLKVTNCEPLKVYGSPTECDLCSGALKKAGAYVDGAIKSGGWANMCLPCFVKHGAGLGWGKAQLYQLAGESKDGHPRWTCIAGGPAARSPAEEDEDAEE